MRTESIVLAVAGAFFGLIVGWVIGAQQARQTPLPQPSIARSAPTAETSSPPRLDEARVAALRAAVEKDAGNVQSRVELGNLYYDAERFEDAAAWYKQALAIDPDNADVSTDLGVSYYYLDRPDDALAQFERSLKIDPRHTKTILNQGIVRAFGKQDLAGAAESWRRVIEISPDSPEGQTAARLLDSLAAAHPNLAPSGAGEKDSAQKGSR